MRPIKHRRCNGMHQGLPGTNHLHTENKKMHVAGSYRPVMCTFWEPSPEDIQRLVSGGIIELMIVGDQHPPVDLQVYTGVDEYKPLKQEKP